MPKKRKYKTKDKTTTRNGKNAYMKQLMADRREQKRILKQQLQNNNDAVERLKKIPVAYELIFGKPVKRRRKK